MVPGLIWWMQFLDCFVHLWTSWTRRLQLLHVGVSALTALHQRVHLFSLILSDMAIFPMKLFAQKIWLHGKNYCPVILRYNCLHLDILRVFFLLSFFVLCLSSIIKILWYFCLNYRQDYPPFSMLSIFMILITIHLDYMFALFVL